MVVIAEVIAVLIGFVIVFAAMIIANLLAFWLSLYVLLRGVQTKLSDTLEQTDLSDSSDDT
jgi:uncharacterized membrane protein YdjX (TVP38/TMEM64 family)